MRPLRTFATIVREAQPVRERGREDAERDASDLSRLFAALATAALRVTEVRRARVRFTNTGGCRRSTRSPSRRPAVRRRRFALGTRMRNGLVRA